MDTVAPPLHVFSTISATVYKHINDTRNQGSCFFAGSLIGHPKLKHVEMLLHISKEEVGPVTAALSPCPYAY